jgi:hypothetical protein
MHVRYRINQFWRAVSAAPSEDDLRKVNEVLSPQLMSLFRKMQASEQAHSINIYKQLRANGDTDQDLLVAALLHDVGKSRFPLDIWERILIVIGNTFFPRQVKRWGKGEPSGWKRSFVIAENHPTWGAGMAAEAGASTLTARIIQRHQEVLSHHANGGAVPFEDQLIQRLQLLDDKS